MNKRYDNVFDAIAGTPQEALNMKLRAEMINEIRRRIEQRGWTQQEAAEQLGITQPRVSDLLRGKLSRFSLDVLVNMLATLGGDIELKIKVA